MFSKLLALLFPKLQNPDFNLNSIDSVNICKRERIYLRVIGLANNQKGLCLHVLFDFGFVKFDIFGGFF